MTERSAPAARPELVFWWLLLLLPTLYMGGKLALTRRMRRESNLEGKRKDGTDPTEGKEAT